MRGGNDQSFVAVDNFLFLSSQDCVINPPEADPSFSTTTTTPAPTEPPGPVLTCSFQDNLCDWAQITDDPAKAYKWLRKSSQQMIDQKIPGPNLDADGNTDGVFVVASDGFATSETIPEAVTLLRSPFFLWNQHPYECFTFHYFFSVRLSFIMHLCAFHLM